MNVTVFKPAGRTNFVCQWVDPISGKKKTKSAGTAIKRDAERFAGKLQKDLENGTYYQESRMTWEDFRDCFETVGMSGRRQTTRNELKTTLNLVEKYINPARPHVITTAVVSSFAMKLRTEQKCREMTVKKHLSGLRAVMNWAKDQGYVKTVPKFTMPRCTGMKGRPITGEEFDRMLSKAPDEQYRFLMRGLWLSGLRISEAIQLSWDAHAGVRVDFSGRRPMIDFSGQFQKNGKDQLIPITPDFYELLTSIPEAERFGRVFGLEYTSLHASKVISSAGKAAKIIVAQDDQKTIFASAHDLRRSFGHRWAKRIPAHDLQLVMRHSDIKTTLKFYVGQRSEDAGDAVWGASANTLANTSNSALQASQ